MNLCRLSVCGALLLPGLLFANGGADHDHGPAAATPPAPATQALRVEAASELFELVGTLQGDQLVIHLDRFATNAPVTGAKIAVEGGPLKATAAVERDGTYTVAAAGLAAPGTHPLVFTIQAGAASDLLTGDLVVASPAPAAAPAGDIGPRWIGTAAVVTLITVLVLGVGVFAWRRRRTFRRTTEAGAFQ